MVDLYCDSSTCTCFVLWQWCMYMFCVVTVAVQTGWNVMAHAQEPDFVFRRNGRVHLNRRGTSVQSTTGSRGVRISDSNAGYTMFRGSVKSTGYPLHSPITPFTSPPVRHRVPSHFNWTLPRPTIIRWPLSAMSRVRPPASSCDICEGQWGKRFFPPQKLRFSPVSIIPSLLHTHSSIYYRRYLISGNDNAFKWRTKIVTVLRFFPTVSLHECSHTHSSSTDVIHSQKPTVSLKKTPFCCQVFARCILKTTNFVKISIRWLRISCTTVRLGTKIYGHVSSEEETAITAT